MVAFTLGVLDVGLETKRVAEARFVNQMMW
jgi:hypothetical protein